MELFKLTLVLTFLGVSYTSAAQSTLWGVKSKTDHVEKKFINLVAPFNQPLVKTIVYPEDYEEAVKIAAVEISDYNFMSPANVTIVDGGIGSNFIKIRITSERGEHIKTIFSFYYRPDQSKMKPVQLDSFFETSIDILEDD